MPPTRTRPHTRTSKGTKQPLPLPPCFTTRTSSNSASKVRCAICLGRWIQRSSAHSHIKSKKHLENVREEREREEREARDNEMRAWIWREHLLRFRSMLNGVDAVDALDGDTSGAVDAPGSEGEVDDGRQTTKMKAEVIE